MRVVVNNSALMLERRQTLELVDAAGSTAVLDKGCLWITMAGDPRDILLGPGQSFTVDRNGKTLLHAEVPSTLRIATAPVPNAMKDIWDRIRGAIDGWAVRSIDEARVLRYY